LVSVSSAIAALPKSDDRENEEEEEEDDIGAHDGAVVSVVSVGAVGTVGMGVDDDDDGEDNIDGDGDDDDGEDDDDEDDDDDNGGGGGGADDDNGKEEEEEEEEQEDVSGSGDAEELSRDGLLTGADSVTAAIVSSVVMTSALSAINSFGSAANRLGSESTPTRPPPCFFSEFTNSVGSTSLSSSSLSTVSTAVSTATPGQ
jgi:hypothetical protein